MRSGKYEKEAKAIGKSINNKDRSTTLIKEPEASIVRELFEAYAAGTSVKELVKRCQQKAYPSPDAKAGWSSRSIYRILANECYTGKIVQGKTRTVSYKNQARIQIPPEEWIRIAHVHEPIISEEMFFFVQEKKHRRFTE